MNWIGVDLDGTLARYTSWNGGEIGEPVPAMAERVRRWLAEGREVRIVTARVGFPEIQWEGFDEKVFRAEIDRQRTLIQDWTEKHLGARLTVTATKDFAMIELWDDRAVTVEKNTGHILTAGRS